MNTISVKCPIKSQTVQNMCDTAESSSPGELRQNCV